VTGSILRAALVALVALLVFGAGVVVGGHPVQAGLVQLPEPIRGLVVGESAGGLTSEVLDALERDFFREIDREALDTGSVDQIIATLDDPYTDYLTKDEYEALKQRNDGRYTGVGLQVAARDGQIVITKVFEGGPAEAAGLMPEDVIVRVEGVRVNARRINAAAERIRGPEGSTVTISIRRGRQRPRDVELTRASIALELTEARMLTVGGTRVGYVLLRQFARGAGEAVRADVEALVEDGAEALVLDLRANPGGLVDEAVEVSGVFLDKGDTVVTTEGRSVEEKTLTTDDEPVGAELPVVVLVDAGSASASEIVAGALHDAERAELAGHPTFGKALVQSTRPLRDGGALKLTIARYRTPSGQDINEKGLVPDTRAIDDPTTAPDEGLRAAARHAAARAG
jgi:carboxyl-terminal processing protease